MPIADLGNNYCRNRKGPWTMTNTYNKKLAQVRENEKKHDEEMTIIAERGGKTLNQLRAMTMVDKDAFITKYRKNK